MAAPVFNTYQKDDIRVFPNQDPSYVFQASGATSQITQTGFPSGLFLNNYAPETASLDGTTSTLGSYPYTVSASNADGTSQMSGTINVIEAVPPSITNGPPPGGRVSIAYDWNAMVDPGNGDGFPQVSISGTLPNGLTAVGGHLSGTPTEAGSFPITATVTGQSGTRTYNYTLAILAENTAPTAVTASQAIVHITQGFVGHAFAVGNGTSSTGYGAKIDIDLLSFEDPSEIVPRRWIYEVRYLSDDSSTSEYHQESVGTPEVSATSVHFESSVYREMPVDYRFTGLLDGDESARPILVEVLNVVDKPADGPTHL